MELMRLHRIDHVSLDVADRARSLAWYEDILGARAARRTCAPEEPIFIGPARRRLGLFAERAPGLRHIALATDLHRQDGVVQRLEGLAIPYRRERHCDHTRCTSPTRTARRSR